MLYHVIRVFEKKIQQCLQPVRVEIAKNVLNSHLIHWMSIYFTISHSNEHRLHNARGEVGILDTLTLKWPLGL